MYVSRRLKMVSDFPKRRCHVLGGPPPWELWVSTSPFSELRNAIPFNFFLKISSWVDFLDLIFFVVFWTPGSLDPDRFPQKSWFSCSVHGHGRGTCRSPILELSSAIERRARGLSFPLLRIFIGYQQLLQRAAWSAKSWQNTTVSNTTTHTDNYAQLSLDIVSSPLLTLYGGKGGKEGRERWIHISGIWWHAQLS